LTINNISRAIKRRIFSKFFATKPQKIKLESSLVITKLLLVPT